MTRDNMGWLSMLVSEEQGVLYLAFNDEFVLQKSVGDQGLLSQPVTMEQHYELRDLFSSATSKALITQCKKSKAAQQSIHFNIEHISVTVLYQTPATYALSLRIKPPTALPFELLLDHLPQLVSYIDKKHHYQYVNKNYEKIFKRQRDDIQGKSVKNLLGDKLSRELEPTFQKVLQGEVTQIKKRAVETRDKTIEHLEAKLIPHIVQNEVVGFFSLITNLSEQNKVIQLLQNIHRTVHTKENTSQQIIEHLVSLGREYLALDIGIVAKVEKQQYSIFSLSTDLDGLKIGDSFELGLTYCVKTLLAKDVVATTCAKDSEVFKSHPCYKNFALETYIGIPLFLEAKVWGTLNFSSANIREKTFNVFDYELLRLMASAIENVLYREKLFIKLTYEKEELEEKATVDMLTKLPNRYLLNDKLNALSKLAPTKTQQICMSIIDIDDFKSFNDQYGHAIGDEVLVTISQMFQQHILAPNIIGRLGGEEFLIIFYCPLIEAKTILEHMIKTIAQHEFIFSTISPQSIQISAGLTTCFVTERPSKMMMRADKALYQAKNNGKNQLVTR